MSRWFELLVRVLRALHKEFLAWEAEDVPGTLNWGIGVFGAFGG